MTKLTKDLKAYGIEKYDEIYHNLSYDDLFKHETSENLEGFEKGFETELGAVAVDTGIFTGRSPKDKYIVNDEENGGNIWWKDPKKKGSDNKPISKEVWKDLYDTSVLQLNDKKLYVTDAFCGANENSRLKIRVISEVAWQSHFVKNMFITPTDEELKDFEPDFVMLNACKTVNAEWDRHKLNSDVYVAFNIEERMAVVGGTWYGGEIKKGFFSIMNYFLPLNGIASMHCSANMGKNGDTAIFFGLSGTGKTTLSADPERYLIGDDEHGWDDDGVFNLEGGCYAKCINLKKENEPDIYNAIRRNALLENVVYDDDTAVIDFSDSSKTENTRVSYPIDHIENIVRPISKGGHPKNIIFLTADAFGVLPPVAKLTNDQAMYYFLSGYTAKLAGTERGVKEPLPTFSSAFGAAFLLLHPTVYAKALAQKMEEHGSTAYLVNTGWIGGPYGIGKRIDLEATRNIINAILDGTLEDASYEELPLWGLQIPRELEGVDTHILNPRNTWKYETAYEKQAQKLAESFISNFENFTDTEEGKRLVAAGPKNKYMKQFYDYYDGKIKANKEKYTAEIARLKDQIYILQNSFGDYIFFNSINKEYKVRPLKRHIPIYSFFKTENKQKRHDIQLALIKTLDAVGFNFYNPEKEVLEYNTRIGVSKERLTIAEMYETLDKLQVSIKTPEKCKNKELIANIESFKEISKELNEFAIKFGNLLVTKITDEEGVANFDMRKLSISGLIHLDKNPELMKKPQKMLEELNTFMF